MSEYPPDLPMLKHCKRDKQIHPCVTITFSAGDKPMEFIMCGQVVSLKPYESYQRVFSPDNPISVDIAEVLD